MIVFPNCKINLGLLVLQKRADGFHDLETIFYPIPIQDALEIIPHPNSNVPAVTFNVSGNGDAVHVEDNSCVKAYGLLKKDFPSLPPVEMHLHKAIPIGAGLGGGSADGAFTLMLLNKKFHLQLSEHQLIQYASQLGSDCAFFIKNGPCYAKGRGEILEEISLDLTSYKIILVNPQIHIGTRWAYSQIKPAPNRTSIKKITELPVSQWHTILINDFEEPIFRHYPQIKNIKEIMYQQGAVYAAMTGSGSTVFGIFEKSSSPTFLFPDDYYVKEVI